MKKFNFSTVVSLILLLLVAIHSYLVQKDAARAEVKPKTVIRSSN